MSKVDISLERQMAIQTKQFFSIRPTVKVTLKDVDSKNVAIEYEKASNLLDALVAKETIAMGEEIKTVSSLGFDVYFKALKDHELEMNEVIINYKGEE